jgi:tetratricopeptide (TPR) repeat protein
LLEYISRRDHDEVLATALVRLLRPCEDERKWPALLQALKDPSPLVRASAAEGLDGHLYPESAAALLTAAGDEYRLVRVRAAASLAGLPADQLDGKTRPVLERATDEFLAVVRARPDDSASHHNLGNFYIASREYDLAATSFERAFQLLPDNAAPLVNAALAHNAAGRNAKAEGCLRRALQVEPGSVAANLNLGLLLGEMERLTEAESALRAAFKADPQSAVAAFNVGVIVSRDRPDEGIEWCRKAAQLRPQEPKYAYTLAFYLRRRGDTDGAVATLRGLTDRDVPFADAFTLLGQIYEEQRRTSEAIAVYRRAAMNDKFDGVVRDRFAARAAALSAP